MRAGAGPAPRPAGGLGRLNAALHRGACLASVALFAAIFVIMLLQIAFRYLLNAPLVWTEEAARYLYIWACYLGAAVALRRGHHIVIALVWERLPSPLRLGAALGTQALGLLFLGAVAVLGVQLMARTHSVQAITLPVPWSLIYAAAPVAATLMCLETLEGMRRLLAELRGRR